MHGLIFQQLRRYVTERMGAEAWRPLLQAAKLDANRLYFAVESYPDSEALALVAAAAERAGVPARTMLEDIGEFITPELLGMYSYLLAPAWRTLEVIENTEAVIHRVVRIRDKKATPPELLCHRVGPHQLMITYHSQRRMCGLARGIARGIARHYHEQIAIQESRCMLQGDTSCELSIRLLRA